MKILNEIKTLKIKDKNGTLVDFCPNKAQLKLIEAIEKQTAEQKPIRVIILKARQMGFSTIAEALIFIRTIKRSNVSSGVIAHESQAASNLFRMSKRFYDTMPQVVQAKKEKRFKKRKSALKQEEQQPVDSGVPEIAVCNSKELGFSFEDGESFIRMMTAGNDTTGRGETFQNLHISEYAFWKGDKTEVLLGLAQTVPASPDTMVVIESTANGHEAFYNEWKRAISNQSDFIPVFTAWFDAEDYVMPFSKKPFSKDELELKALYSLTDDQMEWRRWCIKNKCQGSLRRFKQEYPSCAEEAFLLSKESVFDNEVITERIEYLKKTYLKKPFLKGSFNYNFNDKNTKDFISGFSFLQNKHEYVRIFKPPQKDIPYVIGADTKGEGKDFYAATVLNNVTGERVASIHMDCDNSKPFTYQLYCLGKHYNDALIGVEVNFNTAPVEELMRLSYPKQYVRERRDDFKKTKLTKYGFRTDGNTRSLIIDKQVDNINNNIELFNDVDMLREALTFVYDKNGRPDALSGNHDDLLFSDMIAAEIRGQQSFRPKTEQAQKKHYSDDMLEDFISATPLMKQQMIEKWGEPLND